MRRAGARALNFRRLALRECERITTDASNFCDNANVKGPLMAAVVLAGCGGGGDSTLGKPCSLKMPCATDEICDMTDANGPVCISVNGDLDGDGIPNGQDYCEHAAGGRYDEDRDGIGDECDPCPIAPPPATPDPDGDAVDSPCDPDPHTPGDTILMFDGFNSPTIDPRWKATTPSAWTAVGGEIVVDLTSVATEDYLTTNSGTANHFAVLAGYYVDGTVSSSSTHIVGIHATDPRPAGVAQFECSVNHNDLGNGEVIVVQTNMNFASSPVMGGFESASLYELAAYSDQGSVGCSGIKDNGPLGATQAAITPDALATAALAARSVKARFEWILVVGH